MSWAEIYKVNSDLQGEPLNFLSYLQDIKLNGLDSYVLFIGNARIWEELYLNSLYLFSDRGIRETVYTAFSETDIDNLFDKSTKLGEQLNAFYRTDVFSLGNADNVVKGMTVEHYNSLEEKFKAGYDRYVTREQEKSTIGAWFNSTFSLDNTDLENLTTIEEILANTEATNAILNNSNAIVALTMCKSSMDAVVASPNAMDLLGQYILKVTTEPAVIRAIIKNEVIRDAIISSVEVMKIIVTNTNSMLEIFNDLEATKILTSKQNSMDEILKNNEIAKEIIPKIIATKDVATSIVNHKNNIKSNLISIENQFTSLNYKDDTFLIMKESKEILDNMKLNNNDFEEEINSKIKTAEALINSSTAISSIARNSNCMSAIASNPLAIAPLISVSSVMNIFASSDIAMNLLANSDNAMTLIKNNSTAMSHIVNSSTAMHYIADSSIAMSHIVNTPSAINKVINSSVAMGKVATTGRALREICKVESVSVAIAEKMQAYSRASVISALNNSSLFSKTTVNVGNGNGTVNDGLATNTIYIPTSCYDDGDTSFAAYYGCKNSLVVVSTIAKHNGNVAITRGVSFRGVRVTGEGNSIGYITFDKYTAL
ncbi:TPA: phage tail protein [Clostridioides difficile]